MKVLTAPVTTISQSIKDWLLKLSENTQLTAYGEATVFGVLFTLLFFHFLTYVLENNTGIQTNVPGLYQILFETRLLLQVTIVKNFLYYGAFILALVQGAKDQSFLEDAAELAPITALLILVWAINKFCVWSTGNNNPEYAQVGVLTNPWITSAKSRTIYVLFSWTQTVTDIILQQVIPGGFYGYAVGKVARAIVSN